MFAGFRVKLCCDPYCLTLGCWLVSLVLGEYKQVEQQTGEREKFVKEGLIRLDPLLPVLYVGNEEDQTSTIGSCAGFPWCYLTQQINSSKDYSRSFTFAHSFLVALKQQRKELLVKLTYIYIRYLQFLEQHYKSRIRLLQYNKIILTKRQ